MHWTVFLAGCSDFRVCYCHSEIARQSAKTPGNNSDEEVKPIAPSETAELFFLPFSFYAAEQTTDKEHVKQWALEVLVGGFC